jgi:hypothetical protein
MQLPDGSGRIVSSAQYKVNEIALKCGMELSPEPPLDPAQALF